MGKGLIVVIAIIALVVILVMWFIGTYNNLVSLRTNCEEGFSTMDVYLKKRFDLIPNLVATVKGYAKHEAETLEKVVKARGANAPMTDEEKIEQEAEITKNVRNIMALSESYPDLKANTNFQELMGQLKVVEEDISNARKYYNGCVKLYNVKVQTIPTNIVAGLGHFEKKKMFEVDSSEERQNVKVSFE